MENCGNWMVRYSKLLTSSDPHQLTFYLTYILTFYLAFCLVRQCPLRSGARGWGGGGRRKAEGGGRRDAPVIKSRDPHLAGGEWKTRFPSIGLPIPSRGAQKPQLVLAITFSPRFWWWFSLFSAWNMLWLLHPDFGNPFPLTLNTPQTKSWLLPDLVLDLFIWGIHRQVSLLKRTRFKSKGYPYDLGNLHIERWRKKPDGLHWYRTAPPQQPRTHVPVAEPEAWDIAELVEIYGKRTCQYSGNPIHTGTYTWS